MKCRVDVVLQIVENLRHGGAQCRGDARSLFRCCLDDGTSIWFEVRAHRVDRVDVRQIAFVVLKDDRHFLRIEAIEPQIRLQVFEAVDIRIAHRVLRIGHKHDAVGAAQHEFARGVVEHLTGDGVELHAHFLSGDRAELHRHEVEEERAIRLRRHRNHLPFVVEFRIRVDLLEIRRLPAQTGAVVDEFHRHFVDRFVD